MFVLQETVLSIEIADFIKKCENASMTQER